MRTFSIQLPLDPLSVGQVVDRTTWPAHITLIGNFRADDAAPIEAVLARFAPEVPPIRAVVGEEAWFGPGGTVLVDLVEVPVLRSLHGALLHELESAVDGLEMLLPHHTRDAYWPHRTVTAGPRPSRGDVLEASVVTFCELDPPGRPGIAVILGAWRLEGARQQDSGAMAGPGSRLSPAVAPESCCRARQAVRMTRGRTSCWPSVQSAEHAQ